MLAKSAAINQFVHRGIGITFVLAVLLESTEVRTFVPRASGPLESAQSRRAVQVAPILARLRAINGRFVAKHAPLMARIRAIIGEQGPHTQLRYGPAWAALRPPVTCV